MPTSQPMTQRGICVIWCWLLGPKTIMLARTLVPGINSPAAGSFCSRHTLFKLLWRSCVMFSILWCLSWFPYSGFKYIEKGWTMDLAKSLIFSLAFSPIFNINAVWQSSTKSVGPISVHLPGFGLKILNFWSDWGYINLMTESVDWTSFLNADSCH